MRPSRALPLALLVALALSVGPSLRTWATQPWPPPWFAEETGTGTESP